MQIKKIFEQLNPKKIVLSNIYQNISLLLFPRPTDILMHNPNLYIDKTFFRSLSERKMACRNTLWTR